MEYGFCPRDKPFPDELVVVRGLSYAKLNAFDLDTHGQFFWNFRTEFEPRWDYQQGVHNKVIPSLWLNEMTLTALAVVPDGLERAA